MVPMSDDNASGPTPSESEAYFGSDTFTGVFGQNRVGCVPFSTSVEEAKHPLRKLKVELVGLLTTTGPLTAPAILQEFKETYETALDDCGFDTVEDLLATMPDVVTESFDGNGVRIYMAKRSEKTEDLHSLISRQRYSPSKRNNRQPCSNGLLRGAPVTRTAATLLDKQPSFRKYRVNWMEGRVASTKAIGQFPCPPKANRRHLAGNGPKSEERCCMVAGMVREIGQLSEDKAEMRCHIDHLKDFYYHETGLALLGKIHSVEEYAVQLALPQFAKFWRIQVEPNPDPQHVRYYIIVRSEGFYPVENIELSNSSLASTVLPETSVQSLNSSINVTLTGSPHLGHTDRPNSVEIPAEEPRKTPSPNRTKISPRGIGIVRSIVNQNLRDCRQRGDNKPCNRLPASREDLHSRRSTPDGCSTSQEPQETVNTTVSPNEAESKKKAHLEHGKNAVTEGDLEWMKAAKVVELAAECGANYFVPLYFAGPHSVILSSYWGNEGFERFSFYEEKLRKYHEQIGFVSVAADSHVFGKEYVIRSDGRFARAIYVEQSSGSFCFVLLDCHALAHVSEADILDMPPGFSSRNLPCNAFLASIRGVKDVPQDLYATIETVVRPQNGLVGGPVVGEIFYTNQGKTRLVDWVDPAGTGLWFSQFCLDTGAVTDEAAPQHSDTAVVEESFNIIKESEGFTFDKEVEELVMQQAGLSLTDDCEVPRGTQVQIDFNDNNCKTVRFSDQPPHIYTVPQDVTCNTTLCDSESSLVIHEPENSESNLDITRDSLDEDDDEDLLEELDPEDLMEKNDSKDSLEEENNRSDSLEENETVKSLLSFILLSSKYYSPEFADISPQISDFNANFFRSLIPDKQKREYAFHRMLATIYSFKLIWTGEAEQDALDLSIQRVSSWLHEIDG